MTLPQGQLSNRVAAGVTQGPKNSFLAESEFSVVFGIWTLILHFAASLFGTNVSVSLNFWEIVD